MVMILEPSQVASQLVGGQEQARVSILTSGPMLQPYDSGLSAVAWPGHRTILRRPQATALSFLVLLAVALITPIYNEVMVGISSPPPTRPSHAWVSVDEVDGGRLVESRREQASDVDVAIRQAWVRGPWMRALERQTLATAAAVEDRLAPYGSGAATAVGRGAAIHSLLDHWDHSAEQMASDDDVVGTVVGPSSRRLSRAGVSLRPESTLAGFARASSSADAVVTTMLCDDGSDAARFWDRSVAALLRDPAKWHASLDETLDGILARIQHLPAGTSDNVAFFTLYSAAAIYGWVGLSEHGMLKSRLWLLMYIFAEATLATALAKEICSLVGIATSTVPAPAYPLYSLAQSLANSLRLVHHVSHIGHTEVPQRISLALRRLGATPFLAAAQSAVVLLLTAAHASAAGLTSFCRFAIISLVIDLVAFFTFFIAALALSLRPRGLPDSVDDSTQSNSLRKGLRETIYQRGRRMQGNDVPTKRTGVGAPSLIVDLLIVIGLTCFAGLHFLDASTLAVQHHVTMPQGYPTILHRYLSAILGHDSRNYHRGGPDTVSWFRGQSPVTLGEFVQVVKPQSSSFFAKVYAPLLVVSDVAARNASLAAADSSSHHQAKLPPPLLLGGVLVSLLLLLPASIKGANGRRSVGGDGSAGGNGGSGGGISLARCLARLHELDIFILTSCSRRFLVSVGFDRQLRLWNLEAAVPEEEPSTLIVAPPKGHGTDSGSDAAKDSVSWPVSLAAVDDHTDWVAFCSRNGHVTLWNRRTRVFGRTVVLEPGEHVAACFVVAVPAAPHPALHGSRRGSDGETTPTSTASATMATTSTRLLIVLRSGRLLDIDVHRPGATIKHKICEGAVRSPHVTWTSMGGGISGGGPRHGPTLKLATVTQDESVFESTRRDGRWTTRPIRIAAVGLGLGQFRAGTPVGTTATPVPLYQQPQARPRVRVSVVESLRGIALIYDEERGVLHLVDMVSDAIIYTFRHRPAAGPRGIRLGSLRALHPPPRQCVSCGSSAVASFSVAYTENLGGDDAATARDGDGTNKNRAGSVFTMTSVSVAPSAPRPVLCLRAERDSRERRCLGLAGGVEVTHRLENPGVWEATGANGVAGVRRLRHGTPANSPEQQHGLRPGVFPRGSTAMPSSSWTSATTALSAGIGIGRRRRTAAATVAATTTSVAGHKADGGPAGGPTDRWQAWTMTAAGVVGTHELPAARLGLPADTAGPACRLARNAVAVAIANVIVLVQLGQQLRDDDPEGAAGAGGELAPGGTRTRSGRHSRQTSRFGRETVALPT